MIRSRSFPSGVTRLADFCSLAFPHFSSRLHLLLGQVADDISDRIVCAKCRKPNYFLFCELQRLLLPAFGLEKHLLEEVYYAGDKGQIKIQKQVIMQAIFWTVEEVAQKAKQFYDREIRSSIEIILAK